MMRTLRALIANIRGIGVDLARKMIHAHAVDGAGQHTLSRTIKRDQFLAWCEQLPPGLSGARFAMM
jgi:transposase